MFLGVEHARYKSYKNHDQAVQDYNNALKMGTVRQIQARTMTQPVPMAPSHGNDGSGKNVIIITLVVLVFVLWNRLSKCCSCN